jgi:hypothetical protein
MVGGYTVMGYIAIKGVLRFLVGFPLIGPNGFILIGAALKAGAKSPDPSEQFNDFDFAAFHSDHPLE